MTFSPFSANNPPSSPYMVTRFLTTSRAPQRHRGEGLCFLRKKKDNPIQSLELHSRAVRYAHTNRMSSTHKEILTKRYTEAAPPAVHRTVIRIQLQPPTWPRMSPTSPDPTPPYTPALVDIYNMQRCGDCASQCRYY